MNNPYKYRGSRDVLHLLKYVLFRRRRDFILQGSIVIKVFIFGKKKIL